MDTQETAAAKANRPRPERARPRAVRVRAPPPPGHGPHGLCRRRQPPRSQVEVHGPPSPSLSSGISTPGQERAGLEEPRDLVGDLEGCPVTESSRAKSETDGSLFPLGHLPSPSCAGIPRAGRAQRLLNCHHPGHPANCRLQFCDSPCGRRLSHPWAIDATEAWRAHVAGESQEEDTASPLGRWQDREHHRSSEMKLTGNLSLSSKTCFNLQNFALFSQEAALKARTNSCIRPCTTF